jgi:hypothetical protein
MGIISQVLAGGANDLIKTIGDEAAKFIKTPEEKDAFAVNMATIVTSRMQMLETASTDEIKAFVEDSKNSRDTNVQLQTSEKVPTFTKVVPYAIASFLAVIWGFLTVYIIMTYLSILKHDATVNMEGVLGMYATVTATFGIVLNFFFGNTQNALKNADRKQAMIETMVNK